MIGCKKCINRILLWRGGLGWLLVGNKGFCRPWGGWVKVVEPMYWIK